MKALINKNETMKLKEIFVQLLQKYTNDLVLINSFWDEIELHYSDKDRYYHNLNHLQNLFNQLSMIKGSLLDWDMVLFAVFYHDFIYNVSKNDNEELSAICAKERLQTLHLPSPKIMLCEEMILATKGHFESSNPDCNFFIDADLSILGSDWENYLNYSLQIRSEYAIYSTEIYNQGRIKVLEQFLSKTKIYKTTYFYDLFENQARENLLKEINLLKAKII